MSFPRYPNYKDSGVEWLGEVPAHWGLRKIKYIAAFAGGGTPSRDRPDYWNGEIPWVSPKDMKSERIIGAEETITLDGLANSTATLIPTQRILMVVRSGILKHTIPVAINDTPVTLNQDIKSIHFPTHHCSPDYFLRWVQGLNDILLSAWAKQGATVESIEHEYFSNTVIALPAPAEQSAIVAFLNREIVKLDELVTEQQRLIELLKEKREAVISHAVTKGLNPDAPMKPSGVEWLGEVPAHWDVISLRHCIAKIEQGWSPQCLSEPASEGEWGVLKVGCCNAEKFDPQEQKALPADVIPLEQYEIKAGDVLMSRGNTPELVGMATLVQDVRRRLLLSDLVYRVRPRTECVDSEFLVLSLRSRGSRFQIESDATGTSPSMKKIGQANIRLIIIPRPSLAEQRSIVSYIRGQVAKLDVLTSESQRAIELLQERRTALISAAVTGQIDVRAIADRAAA
ncbi:restriction endonuclease subunit S [Corallococcus sp. AB004]|nr:restriction endonuclease subunit S [Corallococcus sp. AB004]